jgi:hypothetical protein
MSVSLKLPNEPLDPGELWIEFINSDVHANGFVCEATHTDYPEVSGWGDNPLAAVKDLEVKFNLLFGGDIFDTPKLH